MNSFMPLITKINDIIKQDYDISNIESFANLSYKSFNIEAEEVIQYFKIIESRDSHPVEKDILSKYYGKALSSKIMTKQFYMKEDEYDSDNDKVSCSFFKKFLACVNPDKYNVFEQIEIIIISDMIKKNMKFTTIINKSNVFTGIITLEEKEDFITMEFIKSKEGKNINLNEVLGSDKSILFSFSFDKSKDDIKPFSDNIKHYVSECLDIYNRKKERDVEMENIKIKESLDLLSKDERKQKEKEMLIKFTKSNAKSEGIIIKTNTFKMPNSENYNKDKFINVIREQLKSYSTLEFKKVNDTSNNTAKKEESKEEENNTVEKNREEEDIDSDSDSDSDNEEELDLGL